MEVHQGSREVFAAVGQCGVKRGSVGCSRVIGGAVG